ncbi:MAG: hypothetical protein BWY32_02299 [bacterium ADurb.Bin243]|nr:MAG: hypothetical protein BWY32_02299 [bacterium ADurb.Bin243]
MSCRSMNKGLPIVLSVCMEANLVPLVYVYWTMALEAARFEADAFGSSAMRPKPLDCATKGFGNPLAYMTKLPVTDFVQRGALKL